ncbi:MAG: peptidoglycan-binding protein, partial [Acidimicrobiales bacterium]
MSKLEPMRLSREDLEAEAGTALPAKEVLSLLDLNVDLDLGLDLAAPIDLAVAANANVVAPIDAAVSANILSALSNATS